MRKTKVTAEDFREIVQLVTALHEPVNGTSHGERLAAELRRIVGAAGVVIGTVKQVGTAPKVNVFAASGASATTDDFADKTRSSHATLRLTVRAARQTPGNPTNLLGSEISQSMAKRGRRPGIMTGADILHSVFEPRRGSPATFITLRHVTDRRFSARDRRLVELCHGAVHWAIAAKQAGPGNLTNADLTPRQRETLALLLDGLNEKQIAARLGRSTHTVHIHIKSIYRAFDVSARAELLARFVRHD